MSTPVVSLVVTRQGIEGSYYYEGDYNEIIEFLHSLESTINDSLSLSIVSERGAFSEYKPYIKSLSLRTLVSDILSC